MTRTVPTNEAAAQLAGLWRVVELCLPTHRRCGTATFRPAGAETLRSDWSAWVDELFRPVLEPSFSALNAAANAGDAVALFAADAGLGRALGADAGRASLRAGREVLLDHDPPQGARLLERLRAAARADASRGHLATVFAVRGQAFHLPAVQLRGALALAECVAGSAGAGLTPTGVEVAEMLEAALQGGAPRPALRLAAV